MVKVTNWCALAIGSASAGGATIQPTFQPVIEKILPAEPILTIRSAMPGKAAIDVEGAAVEEEMLPDLVGQDRSHPSAIAAAASKASSSAPNTRAVGLCGLLNRTSRVRVGERLGQRRFGDPPVGRGQPHQPRHAAGAQHQRQIGVVERLDQHDLVAGLDQGEQARRQAPRSRPR